MIAATVMLDKTPRQIFLRLTRMGYALGHMTGNPQTRQYQRAVDAGQEIPERCLPGRAVMMLSDKEREVLKSLTADDTQDRIDCII